MGLFDKFGKKNKEENRKEESVKNKMNSSGPNAYTLAIEDTFAIKTGGCVVVGMVDGGTMSLKDKIYIISRGGGMLTTQVEDMESYRNKIEKAPSGKYVGILLPDLQKDQLNIGDIISNVEPQQRVDVNQPVFNPRLKGLLTAAGLKSAREHIKDITNLIFEEIAMQAHFLSVVELSREPVVNGDGTATFQKGSQMRFPMISTQDDKHFYPVFTDWEEIRKWTNCPSNKTAVLGFDNYAEMVLKDDKAEKIEGIAINPFGANYILDRKVIEHIKTKKDVLTKGVAKQRVTKDTQVTLGEPKDYPTEMVEAIKAHLKENAIVKRAWLRLMYKEGEYSYLLVVDFEGDRNNVFGKIADTARPYLGDMYIDMVPFADDFGSRAVEGVEPFYQ